MSPQSHNLEIQESHEKALKGVSASLNETGDNKASGVQVARRCLSIIEPKAVADSLGVAVRTIQKWISGESDIPKERVPSILRETKRFFVDDLNKLEDAIDRELLCIYGGRGSEVLLELLETYIKRQIPSQELEEIVPKWPEILLQREFLKVPSESKDFWKSKISQCVKLSRGGKGP